jgi:DNA/RNA-binding domain of Phe-tRNA-synthetase-like protein
MKQSELKDSVEITISDTVYGKSPTLFVETRVIRDVYISFASPEIEERKRGIIAQWTNVTDEQLESNPLITAYRELQRQLGGDTQMLPAVEGLLARGILKGRFPKVNSVVDAANIVSVKHLIPIGLFDFDKINGDVELTLAVSGDQFIPIGKDKLVKLSPGTPILKDAEGIFSAVGSRDSQRTMITGDTRNVLAFSWGIEGIDTALVSLVLDECVAEILRLNQRITNK